MEKIPQLCLFLLIGLAISSTTNGASILNKRGVAESEAPKPKYCQNNSPCGWGIYTPFTRQVDYFMKNTCVCEEHKQCVRTDDDLSVSAYVYRCRDLGQRKKVDNS
ncbi:uncharacterized protein LOC129796270 [Lutzomyia longipalpis]|uniref:Putative conserved secreted protein n=1 Tax=Lutzomyia longipalpis TaxID=7200 RepID=A0A7G3AFZ5_LUTLO|nr:uncharacterized protein LOC129796270 [Lutzomyia longipalpis]